MTVTTPEPPGKTGTERGEETGVVGRDGRDDGSPSTVDRDWGSNGR